MCIPGGVPFREAAVGLRYDTVDRTARIFDIGALSLAKISAHRRLSEKYFATGSPMLAICLRDPYVRIVRAMSPVRIAEIAGVELDAQAWVGSRS